MPKKAFLSFQQVLSEIPQKGPKGLDELKAWSSQYSQSLYIGFHLYKSFSFFGYQEEELTLFQKLQRQFPGELLTLCIEASLFLKEGRFSDFLTTFQSQEVVKALISKRKFFYFEEILYFHHLWALYFDAQQNISQSQKHQKLLAFIMNIRHTLV